MSGPLFLGIFSETCWEVFKEGVEQLLLRLDVVGVVKRVDYYKPCALSVISKILGYAIIIGSLGFKVPQILAVVASKSAEGLSLAAMELDVFVFVASLGYSLRQQLPISAYGEQATVLAQNLALVAAAWIYNPSPPARIVGFVFVLAAACVGIAFQPTPTLPLLPMIAIAVSVGSRVPQLLANLRQGHTGILSPITVGLNVFGALARVFTTLSEAYDPVMLFSYSVSFVLSASLLGQIVYYRRETRAALERQRAKQDKAA